MTDFNTEVGKRFDRLEGKIDRLTEVMANVARVEEQINGQNARLKRHEFRLDEGEKKLDAVADAVAQNTFIAKLGTGILATVWAAAVGAIMYIFGDS